MRPRLPFRSQRSSPPSKRAHAQRSNVRVRVGGPEMAIQAEEAYLLEQVKQQEYERGRRDGYEAAKTEMTREATSQFSAVQGELAVLREQLKAIPDHEDRIRKLESAKAKLIGAVAVVYVAVSVIVALIAAHH